MVLRFGAIGLLLVLAGCQTTTAGRPAATAMPGSLMLVGAAGPGATILAGMQRDGISATGAFTGVEAGVAAFCGGAADGLALESDLSDEQSVACVAAGGSWSALGSTAGDAVLYIKPAIAEDFLNRSSQF